MNDKQTTYVVTVIVALVIELTLILFTVLPIPDWQSFVLSYAIIWVGVLLTREINK